MTEQRLGRRLRQSFSSKHLSDVRRIIHRAEESTLYMKEFSAAKGWILDFDAINQKRYAALPATHPLRLIQPYINIDLMPFDYDGIESELSASWNVQD